MSERVCATGRSGVRRERETCNVPPRLEWKGERLGADEVKARNAVADGGVKDRTVVGEDEVALAVDGA